MGRKKRRAQGKKPKYSGHANASLPPIRPHSEPPVIPLVAHGNVAHVSLARIFHHRHCLLGIAWVALSDGSIKIRR